MDIKIDTEFIKNGCTINRKAKHMNKRARGFVDSTL